MTSLPLRYMRSCRSGATDWQSRLKLEQRQSQVLGIVGRGFVALWHRQQVRSIGGTLHYFPTEWDAWMFLGLCDAVKGMPGIDPDAPYPPLGETAT